MNAITMIGTGYVGLVGGVCLAEMGNRVVCHDIDQQKITSLKQGAVPFYEPGVKDLLATNSAVGRLIFTSDFKRALDGARFVFICVGTPPQENGAADMRAYFSVVDSIGECLKAHQDQDQDQGQKQSQSALSVHSPFIIINKSTVPLGTARQAAKQLKEKAPHARFEIVSNPEFLREGTAVQDFMNPTRIVIGTEDKDAQKAMGDLYASFPCPKITTNWETAEMIKYASNAFLATKISFVNEIAAVCERVGANVKEVAQGMGYDPRIGPQFLGAGIGYGGSCFPKDVRALQNLSLHQEYDFKLLKAVIEVNNQQRSQAVEKITRALGEPLSKKVVGVLGLAYKPETDDVRESAGIAIAAELAERGMRVMAYDPEALTNATQALGSYQNVKVVPTVSESLQGVDVVFLATEWKEFLDLDWGTIKKNMRGKTIVDGRNALDKESLRALGFAYIGFGV